MKMNQREVVELVKHMLARLQESTLNSSARNKIEDTLESLRAVEEMLRNGNGFYDSILLRNEKTLVEVDLERHQVE